MILLLRILPLLAALFIDAMFWLQLSQPWAYPYIALIGILAMPAFGGLIAWRKIGWRDFLEKLAPMFILHLALGFGLVLSEGVLAHGVILFFAGVSAFLSFELLFLLTYNPVAYPVNGLSRIGIAYVPIAVWYTVATSSGFLVFIHSNPVWHVVLSACLGAALFRTTGHPGATERQNRIWTLIGFLVGMEIGWIGLLLPVSMEMQGFLAAIFFSGVLRLRRYLYAPQLGKRLAWSEAIGMTLVLLISLVSAKWL